VSPEICRVCGGPEDIDFGCRHGADREHAAAGRAMLGRPKPSTGDAAVVTLLAPGRVRVRWANGTEADISAPLADSWRGVLYTPSITVRRQEQP
jgi:hypothetical protein